MPSDRKTRDAAALRRIADSIREWVRPIEDRSLSRALTAEARQALRGKRETYEKMFESHKAAARAAFEIIKSKLYLLTRCADSYGCRFPDRLDKLKKMVAHPDGPARFARSSLPDLGFFPGPRSLKPQRTLMSGLADEIDRWAEELEKAEHAAADAARRKHFEESVPPDTGDADVTPEAIGGEAVPDYLRRIAVKTSSLITEFSAMPRFQEMVREAMQRQVQRLEDQREWEVRRQKHFEETVPGNARLRDKEAGPPEKGWCWGCWDSPGHGETAPGGEHREGWTPPDLVMTAQRGGPEARTLDFDPLRPDPGYSLAEQYTVLAVIHDAQCKRGGKGRIDPWPNWFEMREEHPDEFTTGSSYASFVIDCWDHNTCLRTIRESDKEAHRAILRTVRADLVKRQGEGGEKQAAGQGVDLRAEGVTEKLAVPGKALREPSALAMQCYRLHVLRGIKQTELAAMLSKEHKRKVHQGTVSKNIAKVKEYVEAGNVLPDLDTTTAKGDLHYADPAKLDYQEKPDGKVRPRKSPLQYNGDD